MNVLITDGNCRSALAATRSLGRQGVHVVVGDESADNISAVSRFCSEKCAYPSPYISSQDFLEAVHKIIQNYHIDLLLPMSDVALDNILSHENTFSPHILRALPTYKAYAAVSDKHNLLGLATDIGMQIPESTLIFNESQFYEIIDKVRYPVVIKPSRSRLLINNIYVPTSVHYSASKEDLKHLYMTVPYLKEPFLLQQRICGPGLGLFALFDKGNPIAYFSHMRIREKPPSGGASVLCKSIPVDENIRGKAELLLKKIQWNGVVMLEYKVDANTGTPYLIEINGRFWGSLQLSIDAGIDFPYILYKIANGCNGCINSIYEHYQTGIMSRWLLGDLDNLYLSSFKKRNDALSTLCKLKNIWQFLKYNGRYCYFDVLRIDDLFPFINEVKQYLTSMFHSK